MGKVRATKKIGDPVSLFSESRKRLVCGVGINDSDYVVSEWFHGKKLTCQFYQKWMSMLKRCYQVKSLAKRPSYYGCSVSDEWLSFSNFRSWMKGQPFKGRHLDKDILVLGNNIYGSEYCLFVPSEINTLMTDRKQLRGPYPLGVSRSSTYRFSANLSIRGVPTILGHFDTEEEASDAYLKAKAIHIMELVSELSPNEDTRLGPALIRIAKSLIA